MAWLELLQPDDLDLVEEFILEGDDNEFSMNPVHCRDQWGHGVFSSELEEYRSQGRRVFLPPRPLCSVGCCETCFVETAESYPNLRVPEVVLKLSDCVPLGSTKEPYRF